MSDVGALLKLGMVQFCEEIGRGVGTHDKLQGDG